MEYLFELYNLPRIGLNEEAWPTVGVFLKQGYRTLYLLRTYSGALVTFLGVPRPGLALFC